MAVYLYVPVMLREAGLLPKGDIVVAEVISEEIAGYGAMVHTREGRMLTDYAVVGEATENDIAIGSRGRFCAVLTITGKSCHASIPHEGHNPFNFLTRLLPELEKVEMSSDALFGSSTMSITKIESSEKGTNIIPNEVTVYIDYRQTGDDTEAHALEKIQAAIDRCGHHGRHYRQGGGPVLPLTTYTGMDGRGYQGEYPFSVSPDEDYIIQAKAAVEDAVGHTVQCKPWAFATDTGHYAAQGVKCLGYSPAEIKLCHTTSDSIDIQMMAEASVGTMAIVAALCNNPSKVPGALGPGPLTPVRTVRRSVRYEREKGKVETMKQKKPLNLNPFVLLSVVLVLAWLATFLITPGTLVDGVYTALPKNGFTFNNVFNLFRAIPLRHQGHGQPGHPGAGDRRRLEIYKATRRHQTPALPPWSRNSAPAPGPPCW